MTIVIGRGERDVSGGENVFDSTNPQIRRDVQAAQPIALPIDLLGQGAGPHPGSQNHRHCLNTLAFRRHQAAGIYSRHRRVDLPGDSQLPKRPLNYGPGTWAKVGTNILRLFDYPDVDYSFATPGGAQTCRKFAGHFNSSEAAAYYDHSVARRGVRQVRQLR